MPQKPHSNLQRDLNGRKLVGVSTGLTTAESDDTYVDGFVVAGPTENRVSYPRHAEAAAVVFKENGR